MNKDFLKDSNNVVYTPVFFVNKTHDLYKPCIFID